MRKVITKVVAALAGWGAVTYLRAEYTHKFEFWWYVGVAATLSIGVYIGRTWGTGKRGPAAVFLITAPLIAALLAPPPRAHADDGFVCPYPLVGVSATIRIGFEAGGKFCDGPTEVNGTHYHCEAGGATVSGGGIGLAPLNGFTFGGILGGGFGAGGSSCTWRCPDNTLAPAPNPPGDWKTYLVVRDKNNDCLDHMTPAGFWSEPVEADQGPPGFENPHEPPQPPMVPTVTNPGQGNPDDLPE